MPSIHRLVRLMRSLYWLQVTGGASPASSASMCRSDSGTGAKKCLNSESAMMWWQTRVRKPRPKLAARRWMTSSVFDPSE
eukprot:7077682-Alexandrium_andersonii.AAC.1